MLSLQRSQFYSGDKAFPFDSSLVVRNLSDRAWHVEAGWHLSFCMGPRNDVCIAAGLQKGLCC